MLKPKKIIQILSALALLLFLWIAFALIQALFEKRISNHEMYIPQNAESVLEIDGKALIQTFVEDVLLARQFDEQLGEFVNSSENSEPMGMDYLSTTYVFTVEKDARLLTGVLVNILDENLFESAMKKNEAAGNGFAQNNGVGLMLYDSEKNPISAKELNAFAAKIIEKKSDFDFKMLPKATENAKLRFWKKESTIDNGKRSFRNISFSVSTAGNTIELLGTADFQTLVNRTYPVLKRNDLSIQSQFIPNEINAFLSNNLESLGFDFPKITYLSGNYHYSEPSPIPEIKVLPHFDGIYAFDETFNIQLPLISLASTGDISTLNLESFELGGKTIYYKQIDPKTIYLGQSKYRAGSPEKNALFEISGDLKQLLEIRNGGMLTSLLALSPEYSAAKSFLSGIESSEFFIKDRDGEIVDLSAKITFKEGESALNELLQLVLELGVIK